MDLLDFRRNVYSQNGEDGVLAEIFRRLQGGARVEPWCVEFGAWDGKHLSNTFRFVEEEKWNAIYIESDSEKFLDLQETAVDYPRIKPIKAQVGFTEKDSLDNLLHATDLPRDYSLLSVDIDSYDLAVWNAHNVYRPLVVVIEVNSGLLPGVLQWHAPGVSQGNSFSSTILVGRRKGYTPTCHTGNLVFVRDDLLPLLELEPIDIDFPERLYLRFLEGKPKTVEVRQKQGLLYNLHRFFSRLFGVTITQRVSARLFRLFGMR